MTKYIESISGTSNFVTERDAVLYYRDYYETSKEATKAVKRKIEEGEISVGPPVLRKGEKLTLVDGGRRYAIIVEQEVF